VNSYILREATAFLYILRFCNQVLPNLQHDLKWRTLHPTTNFSCWDQKSNTYWDSCKERSLYKIKSNWGLE